MTTHIDYVRLEEKLVSIYNLLGSQKMDATTTCDDDNDNEFHGDGNGDGDKDEDKDKEDKATK